MCPSFNHFLVLRPLSVHEATLYSTSLDQPAQYTSASLQNLKDNKYLRVYAITECLSFPSLLSPIVISTLQLRISFVTLSIKHPSIDLFLPLISTPSSLLFYLLYLMLCYSYSSSVSPSSSSLCAVFHVLHVPFLVKFYLIIIITLKLLYFDRWVVVSMHRCTLAGPATPSRVECCGWWIATPIPQPEDRS